MRGLPGSAAVTAGLHLPGRHYAADALAVAATGLALGVDTSAILASWKASAGSAGGSS